MEMNPMIIEVGGEEEPVKKLAGVKRMKMEPSSKVSTTPVSLSFWGDNYGLQTNPPWIFPSYMDGAFTRIIDSSTLGGVNQPARRINAIAMNEDELGVDYTGSAETGVYNLPPISYAINNNVAIPQTDGQQGASINNAWLQNAIYLGGADDSSSASGRKSTQIRTISIYYKGTIGVSESKDGFVEPAANQVYLFGTYFNMIKSQVVSISLVGENQIPFGRNIANNMPNWGSILAGNSSTKNSMNVLKSNTIVTNPPITPILKPRFTFSVSKIGVNYNENYRLIFQQRYMVNGTTQSQVPIDHFYTISNPVSTNKQTGTTSTKRGADYSRATYRINSNASNYFTQETNALFLITATDLVTSTYLLNVFGLGRSTVPENERVARYNYSLSSIYPSISGIIIVGKEMIA